MKNPMTIEELFNAVNKLLKEEGKLPDILDYGLADGERIPVKTRGFGVINKLDYGASEGIYLDLWLDFDNTKPKKLGTYKTLDVSEEAMHTMAGLLADFTLGMHRYVNQHHDDFEWEGVNVWAYDEDGNRYKWTYVCETMDKAIARKDALLLKHPQVVLRDNATRKETVFHRG